jgi:hypothetical protein
MPKASYPSSSMFSTANYPLFQLEWNYISPADPRCSETEDRKRERLKYHASLGPTSAKEDP